MPELPEVETIRRGLLPVLEGARIRHADVRRPDLRWPFPPEMGARLTGRRVLRLWRRSKYLLADLDPGETLIVHLGMSGRMMISGLDGAPPKPPGRHDHVVIDTEGGARITFNDPRRFGMMDLWPTQALGHHRLLAGLGPEPLGNSFHEDYLVERLKGRRSPIKTALLDQKVVAGLGNIYVCEALHRAGISPLRPAARIAAKRIRALVPVIREVLCEAIESGGSSLRDYRRADGELGYFQHNFRAYGREGEPCLTPGCKGKIARITQSGRSTFHCPQCQR